MSAAANLRALAERLEAAADEYEVEAGFMQLRPCAILARQLLEYIEALENAYAELQANTPYGGYCDD